MKEKKTEIYLSHLECSACGEQLNVDSLWNLCPKCCKPLFVRYDLEKIKQNLTINDITIRKSKLWQYQEILPVRKSQNRLSLGEGFTPLVHAKQLCHRCNFKNLYIKDETLNPTGSFKSCGLGVAVSRAVEL